ncbi:MAG: type III pantothenate kinase [Oscillospiraceae bacterium]|jgi:type III pantothenate kinase|nr:type III pantothenate kinase [Oscillospiraceae bacterium]
MIIAIDVGNTNIVIGCIDGGEILRVIRMSTNYAKTADEYAVDIRGILEFHGVALASISGAVVSCVVPPLTNEIKNAVKLLTGADAIIVSAGVKTGLNILIDDPGTLAGDMAATAVGALSFYTPPLIIVDMGTATKMTVLSKEGSFIGGAIIPGVSLSMNALVAGTSLLPHVPIDAPKKCISSNTVDSMKSGAIYGFASMIDGMTERFEEELGGPVQVIATGGFADAIYRHCKREIVHDPNLILRGLWVIYEKNRKTAK